MRPGLMVQESWSRQGRIWILSDPVVRQYFYLHDEEYELLSMLDGESTLSAITKKFEKDQLRRRLDPRRFMALLTRWHREGLVESLTDGVAETLHDRGLRERRRRRMAHLQNPLFIRLPGWDPTRFLDALMPWMNWISSPVTVGLSTLCVGAAIAIFTMQFDGVGSRLPSLQSFMHPDQWWIFLVVLGVTKVLHELGHAVVCRRLGAEVKQMGVLLMCGMPCLYCDVSDAWRLPRRRDRLLVSAAGMIVEVVLASAATLLWWNATPGLFRSTCFFVMAIGSVNTLLVNGNPLLRYDGYYLLADATGTVNLWARSRAVLWQSLGRCGLVDVTDSELPESTRTRRWLMAYGVASTAYRVAVMVAILWFLYQLLTPLDLGWVVVLVAAWMLVFAAVVPLGRWLGTGWRSSGGTLPIRFRGWVALCIVLVLAGLAFRLPLPHWTTAPAVLQPTDAADVYVVTAGQLVDVRVPLGSTVRQGQPIAELANLDLDVERLRLQGKLQRADERLGYLQSAGATDETARQKLPVATARRNDLRGQLAQLNSDRDRLLIRAPRDGRVWPVRTEAVTEPTSDQEQHLPDWQGQPLDRQQVGSFLETGTWLCSVGGREDWQATAWVSPGQVKSLSPGMKVRLRLPHQPGVILDGEVASLSRVNSVDVPAVVAADFPRPADSNRGSSSPPAESLYQVRINLTSGKTPLWVDARSEAIFFLPKQTAADWAKEFLAETLDW